MLGLERVWFAFAVGHERRTIYACQECFTPEAEQVEVPATLPQETDELPTEAPLSLLELRELQLAHCTRTMREVAHELQKFQSPPLDELATILMNARACKVPP